MNWERRKKLMWRWSLVSAGAIAFFWAVWYLITGSVPVISAIKMTPNWTLELPFGISRLWDILIGPIWASILVLLFTNEKIAENEDLGAGLVFGLVFGLVVGLGAGLGAGLGVGLGAGLVFGLGVGLGAGLVFGLGAGLGTGLGTGLVFGLVFGLGVGLGAGLVFGLVVGLVFGLVVGLGALFKLIFSQKFWGKIGNWLLAKNSEA